MRVLDGDLAQPDRRSGSARLVALSAAAAVLVAGLLWLAVHLLRPAGEAVGFDGTGFGCRFRHPPYLDAGPNYVRASSGAFLTVERHSLLGADPEFVQGLPDVLFPQVRIQLDEGYRDLEERLRDRRRLGELDALHVELEGRPGRTQPALTHIAVDIAATPDWVYVVRAYSPARGGEQDRADFEMVRRTFEVVPDTAP